MENVKERLIKLINEMNISVRKFQDEIGVSNSYVYNMVEQPSDKVLSKIRKTFPFVNIDWIKTGEGDMFITSPTVNNITVSPQKTIAGSDNSLNTFGNDSPITAYPTTSIESQKIEQLQEALKEKDKIIEEKNRTIDDLRFLISQLRNNG